MSTSSKINQLFYQNLGKLFYAIAIADEAINNKEFIALQSCVRDLWLEVDNLEDIFGNDAAYLIETVFEGVEAFELSGEEMYNDFILYKKEHASLFTDKIKSLIMTTAKAITEAFKGENIQEQKLLSLLEEELYVKN